MITLLASGTRGDIQPMIALARGLRDAGLPVKLVAPASFGDWIASYSIPFLSLEGNPSELMLSPGGQSALTFDGNPWRSLRATAVYVRGARPIYARMLAQAAEACRDASALIIGLPTVWGTHIAQGYGIPCIGAFAQPITPTGDFPSPLIPAALSFGRTYNRLTYRVAAQITFLPWRAQINALRQGLGLKPVATFDFVSELDLLLYGFSRHVVPQPADWTGRSQITGYWRLNDAPNIDKTLVEFIHAGEPPFFFGFGSPGAHNSDVIPGMIARAVEQVGARAIVSLPQSGKSTCDPPLLFHLSNSIAHAWLFPQMAGLVHHGGAGTTAAGLMAGVPALITPLAVDQFFWGQRVAALGVGPPPIPQRALTVDKLVQGLKELKKNEMRQRVQTLAGILKDEDGVARAVELIKRKM